MTRNERRALSAINLAAAATDADMVGLGSIVRASGIGGRRLTEDQARAALARLVVRGEVKRVAVTGMGGSMTAWGIAR